jgi:hypothetical protein
MLSRTSESRDCGTMLSTSKRSITQCFAKILRVKPLIGETKDKKPMVTPSPRGFPRTSNTLQVCAHVEDTKRKSRRWHPTEVLPAPREVDLAKLFAPPPRPPPPLPPRDLSATAQTATAYLTVEERKLYIPTGEHYTKKDGSQGAEQKVPFILVTVTAAIRANGRTAFFYRVTNRATKVFDSRDSKRKPIGEVRVELHRLCAPTMACATADALAEWLQPPRDRKPRPRKATDDNAPLQPPPIPARRSAANRLASMITRDSVLAYLRKPLTPLPNFTS